MLAARPDVSVEQAAMDVLPKLQGAFSLVFMDEHTLYAARDAQGVRPLVLGRLERGWIVTSETAALDIVGASFVREIEPGELLAIDDDGLRSQRFASPDPKGCLFEYVYLARPDTTIAGRSVHSTRVELGRRLAREHPADADLVIPVPESGTPAAIGYAEASGIPYGIGLVKNSYVGRTFIQPSQTIRQLGIRLKLNPLRDVIRGKRLVVVDDTIVRGNTQRALVRMLREAGAVEVHVRISAPPVKWPCFYGIDFASKAELVANGLDDEGIRRSIGADSLGYVSLDNLIAASEQPKSRLCRACFDGEYPIALPDIVGKHVLEGIEKSASRANLSTSRAISPRTRSPAHDRLGRAAARHAADGAAAGPRVTSYEAAGVDIDAGERAVELMKTSVRAHRSARRCSAASADSPGCSRWISRSTRSPVLASSTDGVGHEDRHRPRGRPARHDRHRPGRHGRGRPGRRRRRTAVPHRLHRDRQGRSGTDRRRSCAGSPRAASRPAARSSAARPPSTPA